MAQKEKLEEAKRLYQTANADQRYVLESLFPELKESEDEMIRKALIEHFRWNTKQILNEFSNKEALAWLEKQGEHKKFRDSIQVGDEVTRNSDGVIVNLSQLKRVAKKSEQKLPIEKLPSEMKTIRESLGFTTQEECDEYNEMVTNLIMGDDDKGEQKTALSEEELTDFEKSLKHVMEETLECGDIHNLKADADLLLRLVKPTDDDMKEALRTEYEKGRADVIEKTLEWLWDLNQEHEIMSYTDSHVLSSEELQQYYKNNIEQ